MAEVRTCPDVLLLKRLSVGRVSPREAESLEEHLTRCARCQGCLTELNVSDPLLDRLRSGDAIAAQLPQGEVLDVLMRRLRESPPTGNALTEDIGGTSLADDEMPTIEPAVAVADLLGPPRGPGELGWLGPYRVIKVLGTGGMGVVFEAEDPELKRRVALKILNRTWAASPMARKRFQREARAAAAFEHDNIVPIYHVGQENGVFFMVMPLLHGESLDARLERQGRLPVAEAMRIAREIAAGLAAAHDRGLVHRDIKPANIWLESGGDSSILPRVKILDFGLAQAADGADVSQSGLIIGTPAYMAPEQARAETVDHRADLFSLGCVLYRMCAGDVPFKGQDTLSTLTALATDRPRPLREVNPDVPAALSDLVMSLLTRIPAERPASAVAVLQAIEAIERDPGGASSHPGKVGATASMARRHWGILAVAATILLIGLGLTGYHFGPTVIRIATNKGELVIQTVDKDVEVTVTQNGELVEILDLKTRQRIDLRAGDYDVTLHGKAEGLRLSANKFTLKRGRTEIVAVEWLKRVEKRPPAPEAKAFVLLDGKGVLVRKFDTLAEAVAAASDGDTVEVCGNGPFVSEPIKITQPALTVRSGAGFRPVIKLSREVVETNARLLETQGALVVEGLEFQRMAHNEQFCFAPGARLLGERQSPWPALLQASKALHVANCRFLARNTHSAILSDGSVCVVRNCELLCSEDGFSIYMSPASPVKSLVVDNCLATHSARIAVWILGAKESSVQLSRNTWRTEKAPFWFNTRADTLNHTDVRVKVLRVEASGNVFDGGSVFCWQSTTVFPESLLTKLVGWKGGGNVFAGAGPLVALQEQWLSPELVKGMQTLQDWRRFWGTAEANSIRGVVRYQGGDLLSKVRLGPEQLTPDDFRLRPDSAGFRAGKDGKDLGADLDLVGPGKAYERWKKTPQYQEWLKETGQLRANADMPPTGLKLGGPTPADALRRAQIAPNELKMAGKPYSRLVIGST